MNWILGVSKLRGTLHFRCCTLVNMTWVWVRAWDPYWICSINFGYFDQDWSRNLRHIQWFLKLKQKIGWNQNLGIWFFLSLKYICIKKSAKRRCFKDICRSTSLLNVQWTQEIYHDLNIICNSHVFPKRIK